MPGEPWPIELRARHSPEQRCAFCHGGISTSAMACLRCQTLFHEDCAREHGRCPTLGCDGEKPRLAVNVATPDAGERGFLESVGIWTRLVLLTTFLTTISLVTLLIGVLLLLTLSPLSFLAPVPLVISWLSARAVNRERNYQNGLRSTTRAT